MAQTKKKTATKTKKNTAKRTGSKANTRTAKKQQRQQCISNEERMHVYIVTAMAMIAGILLCANAAMMMA